MYVIHNYKNIVYRPGFDVKKEEIWPSLMTKAPTPTEKSKKWKDKSATKNFDYTTIADQLRTVSWSNDSHQSGVVKPVYGIPTFPLSAKAVQSEGHTFKNLLIIILIKAEDQQPTKAERPWKYIPSTMLPYWYNYWPIRSNTMMLPIMT